MDLSIVVPAYNEYESIPKLYEWIEQTLASRTYQWELIFVNDGSNDSTWEEIGKLATKHAHIKGLSFRRNCGKAPALYVGFQQAQGSVVITMDADLQDSPEEIPELYRMILEEKYDLVSGWKRKRFDPLNKRLPSKLFNWIARKATGIKLHDFNCGLKAYRLEVVKSLELYGEMHRYIPVLAKEAGFHKIGEKAVQHQARQFGKSKFGTERLLRGMFDLMTISFLFRFGKRPMHFFGVAGLIGFILGLSIALWLGIDKLYALSHGLERIRVTLSPFFHIGMTLMVLGTLSFFTGFLGELIIRGQEERHSYPIADKFNLPSSRSKKNGV